jgi:hypothetical protein
MRKTDAQGTERREAPPQSIEQALGDVARLTDRETLLE